MAHNIVDLIEFYRTSLGRTTADEIRTLINHVWPNLKNYTYLSIGYPLPFLQEKESSFQRQLVFMPASQGIIHWPDETRNACCLINEEALPLPNESIDRLLVVHSLEHAEYTRPYLRELWRVLSSNGRLLVIVPNRRSLWAQLDETPFGHGNPYTMTQLSRLLKENQFTPLQSFRQLHTFPSHSKILKGLSKIFEHVGPTFFSKFSGLVAIEATKQVYCSYLEKTSPLALIRSFSRPQKIGEIQQIPYKR